MLTAIIVAAGSSTRMGFDKLFADLAGKPVVAWSIAACEACPDVGRVIVVTRVEREKLLRAMAETEGWAKLQSILPGGAQRHLSVWNGLHSLLGEGSDADHVAVHDGARPLVTSDMISRCLELAKKTGAACCAAPVTDTLKRADAENRIVASVDRTQLWAMQTPQTFSLPLLVEAYRAVMATGEIVTDETSALERIGHPVALLNSGDFNLKITYPPDLALARHLLAMRK